jgi:transcriptional regulator with GAF, ATPase, and Fis domain
VSELPREIVWLRRLRDLSQYLAGERDIQRLQPLILDAAMELCGAGRGYLVRAREPKHFDVVVARGYDRDSLAGEAGHAARQAVEAACRTRTRVFTPHAPEQGAEQALLALPLTLGDALLGALYLDRLSGDDSLRACDLPLAEAFAEQAALALGSAELAARAEELPLPESQLVGESPALHRLLTDLQRAARTPSPLLITGAPGTGKSLAAREVHRLSRRASAPYLALRCADLQQAQLERELWGRAGVRGRRGLLLLAGRGSLVLEDVEHLSPRLQERLLRAILQRELPRRSAPPQPLRARLLLTSSQDLDALVAEGRFRADLALRLDVHRVRVPTLGERGADLVHLVRHLWSRAAPERPLELTVRTKVLVEAYAWPRNVAELAEEVTRWAELGVPKISARHVSPPLRKALGY